jgi:HSP20 family protein
MNLRPPVPLGHNNPTSSMMAPFGFGSLQREIDRLFSDFTRGFGMPTIATQNLVPSVDVSETDDEIEVTVELPGLQRSGIDISLNDDVLTIRGEKRLEKAEDDDKRNVHVAERAYGVFYRAIQLPKGVDPASIQAKMLNGVLKIAIPKPSPAQARKIDIKEGASTSETNKKEGDRPNETKQQAA